jgi:hypothetical protein
LIQDSKNVTGVEIWKHTLKHFASPDERVVQSERAADIYLQFIDQGSLVPNPTFRDALQGVASLSNIEYINRVIAYQLNTVSKHAKADLAETYNTAIDVLIKHNQVTPLNSVVDRMVNEMDNLFYGSPEACWAVVDSLVTSKEIPNSQISKLWSGILRKFPNFRPQSESTITRS